MASHKPRILLVEDDPARAGLMVDLLLAADYEVDGPYASVSDGAAALASHFPDGAVLDLHGQESEATLLEDDLAAYDIPLLSGADARCPSQCSRRDLERWLMPWLSKVHH